MAEPTTTPTDQKPQLNIPMAVMEKFSELVEGIKTSESMNHEERQYWIDVLPVMTEDQIENLKDILDNEKTQIEKASKNYEENLEVESKKAIIKFDALKYKEKQQIRMEAEHHFETQEKEHEAALLEEIGKM